MSACRTSDAHAHSRLSMVVKLSVAVRPSSMSSGSPTSSDTSYLDCSCLILVKFVSALARAVSLAQVRKPRKRSTGERGGGERLAPLRTSDESPINESDDRRPELPDRSHDIAQTAMQPELEVTHKRLVSLFGARRARARGGEGYRRAQGRGGGRVARTRVVGRGRGDIHQARKASR